MMRGSRFTRGLALVLCLCMLVPYLPVPGHAEGCGHVHGEECYQEVTSCVHTHGEDCWSAPEAKDAGEEPDVCSHVCGEDTGCVTKELNCAHVHDDTCGEQLREEPEPEQEEPKDEEPKSEEMKSEEPENEAPKQEEENQPLVISHWEWVDPEAVLDPETGVLCLSSEEPILFEQVVELLPKAILATVGEETQAVPLDHWDPKDYPQETGANSGSYLLEAALPEGYALAQDAAALTVPLEFAQAQVLADCGHENVDMDTGKCKDCNEQVYQAKIGDVGYATLGEALEDAQKKENKNCTVTLLCEVDLGVRWHIDSGIFTLDLNKKNNTLGIYLWDGELTIRNGGMKFSDVPIVTDDGILRIESGTYTGGRDSLQRGGGTILISGGEFLKGIESVNKPIVDSLADGKAFFSDPECEQLKDAFGVYLEGPLYVGPHTDNYTLTQDGTYKCGCGRVCETCDHTKVNMETGKCLCGQKQLYEAKIGDTGYATLQEALDDAQKAENKNCTVTLLQITDPGGGSYAISGGIFTLDFNGNLIEAGSGHSVSNPVFNISNAELTITDSSGDADLWGGIECYAGTAIKLNSGKLTVDDVTIAAYNALPTEPVYAIYADKGTLEIRGGDVGSTGEGVLYLSDSVEGPSGGWPISGGEYTRITILTESRPVIDLVAPGYALFEDGPRGDSAYPANKLVDASGGGVHVENGRIAPHTDTYDATTGKCPCGRTCKHTGGWTDGVCNICGAECEHADVDMTTGKCPDCKLQVYEAKIGDTGYATLWDALDAAQGMQNACTVTLLCGVTFSKPYAMDKGIVTLDLNGNTFCSDEGFDINGGSLTLQGGLMLTALQVNDGTLYIESGQYQGSLTRNGGEVILSGGTFMGGMKMQNMRSSPVADFLANGTAFYDDSVNPSELIDASSDSLTNYVTYSIRTHTDTYSSTTGKCPCGRICKHADVDMDTGKCATCQKQLYVAKIGDTGYATLDAALEDAQKAENEGCTVTMLADVDMNSMIFDKGRLTLDLNGKTIKISNPVTVEYGADLTITDSAPGGNSGRIIPQSASSNDHVSFHLRSGKLKLAGGYFDMNLYVYGADNTLMIEDGYVYSIDLLSAASVDISGGEFGAISGYTGIKNVISGGAIVDYISGRETVIALLKDGYALYSDQNVENLVDASSTMVLGKSKNRVLYVLPHTEAYNATTGKCPCGRTIPQATLSVTPTANTLTYNGTDQPLVTAGTATNGRLLYSLEENGTYEEAIPTGRQADTYTVWYYVEGTAGKYYNTEKQSLTVTVGKKDLTPVVTIPDRDFDGTKEVTGAAVTLNGKVDGDDLTYTLGTLEFDYALPGTRTARLTGTPKLEGKDAENYNLKAPTGLTGTVNATSRYLDVTTSLPNADSVTVDGEEYPVTTENGKRYVNLPDTGSLLTVYSFKTGSDAHTSYPEGMQVYTIDRQNTGSTLTEIPEFKDLLLYEGCSIRLNGTKGIRMITSISQENKKALVGSGLAGYTLAEYGTVITRESTLGGKTLNLDNVPSNNYNYAYSKANKKDPVFKTENGRVQYTNVLIGFDPADYQTELVLRPYIKLLDADGNEVVLYGGTVTRSIHYIAQQNEDTYPKGSAGYNYIQKILNGQA